MSDPSEKIPTLWECYKEELTRPFNIRDQFKNNCGHKYGLISAFFIFVIISIGLHADYKKKKKENKEDIDDNTVILVSIGVVIVFTVIAYFIAKYIYRWRVSINNAIGKKAFGITN